MPSKITLKGLQIQLDTLEGNLLETVKALKDLKERIDEIDSEVDVMIDTMFGGGPSDKNQ